MREDLVDELHKRFQLIDEQYYKNLNNKQERVTEEIIQQVARDILLKAEEYFKKGTHEDVMYGIMYRRIAKQLIDTLH
jgi:hypothetical protein